MNDWAVYRLDYNANEFLVEKGLGKERAEELAEEYIRRGHHQHYWVDKQPSNCVDAISMLSTMLKSGSTPKMAVRVLVSQGVAENDCIDALVECTTMDMEESRTMLSEVVDRR